jgi:hypothetical protein
VRSESCFCGVYFGWRRGRRLRRPSTAAAELAAARPRRECESSDERPLENTLMFIPC